MKVFLFLFFCSFAFSFNSLQAFSSSTSEGFSSASDDVENWLQESLKLYFFNDAKAQAIIDWEFLRQGATRVGAAYPKYYLWVKVSRGGRVLSQGAACIALTAQDQLTVTDYFNLDEIQKPSPKMQTVFPKALLVSIKQRAKRALN